MSITTRKAIRDGLKRTGQVEAAPIRKEALSAITSFLDNLEAGRYQ